MKIEKNFSNSNFFLNFASMKKNCLFLMLLLWVQVDLAGAQIFEYSFPFGGMQRRERVQQDPVAPPEYKGGNEALNKYLRKTFKNPNPTDNVDGEIVVACVINEKGKVDEAVVVNGLTRILNEEAERVAKKLKFKPAKQGKKKIKSRFDVVFPIRRGKLSFNKANFRTSEV